MKRLDGKLLLDISKAGFLVSQVLLKAVLQERKLLEHYDVNEAFKQFNDSRAFLNLCITNAQKSEESDLLHERGYR